MLEFALCCGYELQKGLENKTSNGESFVSLLMERRFLVILGTTRTSDKLISKDKNKLPMWDICETLPFPKTTCSCQLYFEEKSRAEVEDVIWVVPPESTYESGVLFVMWHWEWHDNAWFPLTLTLAAKRC